MKQKNVIDKDGFIVKSVFVDENDNIMFTDFKMEDGQTLITKHPNKDMLNPKWTGSKWIEGATEEEIQASKEENKVEVNNEENLIDKLILDNINMQMQIDSLIQANLGGN